jgi:hypothetical protein
MENYNSGNVNGTGITSFEIGTDYITLMFRYRYKYKYTYNSCGVDHVENMKKLAKQQSGLNTYKNEHNPQYAWKIDTGGQRAA